MPYRIIAATPKCTTDQCRSVRQFDQVVFPSREAALAFAQAQGLVHVQIVRSAPPKK